MTTCSNDSRFVLKIVSLNNEFCSQVFIIYNICVLLSNWLRDICIFFYLSKWWNFLTIISIINNYKTNTHDVSYNVCIVID